MFQAIKTMNHFPVKGGISDTIRPETIMTDESLHYKRYIGLQIVQYYQVHGEDTLHNSNHPFTRGAICMGPSGNIQGGFKFMRLRSMKNITSKSCDMILMTDTVIDQVNILEKYQQELLVLTDCKIRIVGDGDVDIIFVDGHGDLNEAPLKNENEYDLNYQEDQEEVHHEQEEKTIIQQPVKV